MESLIKQTRARFTSRQLENKEESGETRERYTASESQSFREKKRSQSWIRRQFSRQMSWDYDLMGADYPVAVAAAAYAIHQSLEEIRTRGDCKDITTSKPDHHRKSSKQSKEEDDVNPPPPRKTALKSSDQSSKKSFKEADIKVPISTQKTPEKQPSHMKKLSFAGVNETITPQHEELAIERPPQRPIRKPSTFGDRHLKIIEDHKKPETLDPKPYRPPTPLPRAQVQPSIDAIRQNANKPGLADSQADAWEKQEMANMKQRYEKLRATIDDWENKKKAKAKSKIEKIEAEMDKKRIKSTQRHRINMKRFEGIAGGARTQADENRRNEEFKIRDKANKIRATGKIPPTCLCF